MANGFYPTARTRFARGEIAWHTATLIGLLVTDAYTYDDADEYRSDLTGIVDTCAITGATVLDDGVLDCDDLVFEGLAIGETATRVIIAKDTGVAATSPLILYFDANEDGLPIDRDGDGGDVTVYVSNGALRLAKL